MMWTLYEPIHAVTYFAPESRAAFEEAGLRGFWRGYFAGRAAPLGPAPTSTVTATFFGFAPAFVERAIPSVWSLAAPEKVVAARAEGATAVLERLGLTDTKEAADLLQAAASELDHAGRVLSAANAALPDGSLWQAATTLREHRGDGHVAALVAAGLDGCESLVLRAGLDIGRDLLQPARGWTDEQWAQAADRLRSRDLLDADGKATQAGTDLYDEIEKATDHAASRPWASLGEARCTRLRELLEPVSTSCRTAMIFPNPIGLR